MIHELWHSNESSVNYCTLLSSGIVTVMLHGVEATNPLFPRHHYGKYYDEIVRMRARRGQRGPVGPRIFQSENLKSFTQA